MDQKVTPESFKAKRDWDSYILKAKPKLTKGCVKSTLVSYCFAMAEKGANGLGCFASDATIADELDLYDYRAVSPYRNEAMRLGWFVWNGKRRGRAKVLDITIPEDGESPEIRNSPADDAAPRVSADGHVSGAYEADCPACQEHIRKLERGEADGYPPTWEIHQDATSRLSVSDA
jgi:hypothetical protein